MFSNNNQISKRQLYRLSIAGNLGTAVLVLPKLAAQSGVFAPIAAGVLMCIYIYAVNGLRRCMDKSKTVDFLLRCFTVIKYSLILIATILILSDIVSDILLPGISAYVVCGACVLTALYVCGNIESISRGAEVLYYFIIIPVLLLCVLSISSVDITAYTGSASWAFGNIKSMISVPVAVILLMPAELLVFINTKDRTDLIKEPLKATAVLTVISIAVYLLSYGISPAVNAEVYPSEKYPIVGLARLTGLPGGFMERQDTLMSIFLVISIIYSVTMAIYGINEAIFLRKERKAKFSSNIAVKLTVALLAIIISSVIITGNILPDFTKLKKSVSTEIENRNYVMAMGIDYEEGKYYISMAFADFTKLSGEAPDGSANNQSVYVGEGADAEAFSSGKSTISEEYGRLSDKMPDFSHVKVIILGKSIAGSSGQGENHLKNVEKYFHAMTRIGRNTLVAVSDKKAMEVISCEENIKSSVGMYIYSMMKNNGYKKCNISRLTGVNASDTPDAEKDSAPWQSLFPLITVNNGLPAIVR